jgi:hypothetical protein
LPPRSQLAISLCNRAAGLAIRADRPGASRPGRLFRRITAEFLEVHPMANKAKRKYSRSSGTEVKNEMHRYKRGTAKSGPGGKGGRVKSRKQAIAIGLSKARKRGKKVPHKKSS